MNISFVFNIIASLAIGFAASVHAAPPTKSVETKSYQFVGMTTAAVLPDGFNSMHATCQAEFGSAARMCTTKEIFESPQSSSISIPHSDAQAWVEPVISSMITDGGVVYYAIGGTVLTGGNL